MTGREHSKEERGPKDESRAEVRVPGHGRGLAVISEWKNEDDRDLDTLANSRTQGDFQDRNHQIDPHPASC